MSNVNLTYGPSRDNLKTLQLHYKGHFDKKVRMRTLNIGDQVLVMLPTDYIKLLMQWKGPYEVIETVRSTDYRIRVGNNTKIFHMNMLKKYVSRSTEEVVATAATLDPPDDSSLEIEPLLGKPENTFQQVSISPELDSY